MNMALSNVDFDLCFASATRCRPKKQKKTVSPKCRVRLHFYKCNSTFQPSDFCNTRLSNVEFDLHFVDAIQRVLKKHQALPVKTILFDSRRVFSFAFVHCPKWYSFSLFPRVPSGDLLASKSWFYKRQTTTCLETCRFVEVKSMFLPPELPCGGFWGA